MNKHNVPIARQFFPQMRLEGLDANHWGEMPLMRLENMYLILLPG